MSPEFVVPVTVHVVVVLADCEIRLAGVVKSAAWHAQPLAAVIPVAPLIVITTVQVPVVPLTNDPEDGPPTVVPAEHPEIVNFVPLADCKPIMQLD